MLWEVFYCLSSVVRSPQVPLVLGVSVFALNQSWLLNLIDPTCHCKFDTTLNTSLIAIFSHFVSWDYSLDNHFRSSCLHRWVPLSPSARSLVVLSCAEWWQPTLCGRWDIPPHGRLSRLICISHSLHAPPLCLPLTGGYASVCTVPVQFHFHLILCFWWCSYTHVWFCLYFLKTHFVASSHLFGYNISAVLI